MLDFASPSAPSAGPRQERRILERAVALVDPQLVRLAVVGDVDVDPPVAVEIGRRHTQRGAELGRQSGARRHIGERSVAVVVVQAAPLLRCAVYTCGGQ